MPGTARLAEVFSVARAERVASHNPLQNRDFTQTYLARTAAVPAPHELLALHGLEWSDTDIQPTSSGEPVDPDTSTCAIG